MLAHLLHVLVAVFAPPEAQGGPPDSSADVAAEASSGIESKDEALDPKPEKKKKKKDYDVDVDARLVTGVRMVSQEPAVDSEGAQVGQPERKGSLALRQARVGVDARYLDILRVRITVDFADLLDKPNPGKVLRNAWANIRVRPWFQIRAGHFKRPYSRLELRGFSSIPFIGRGLFNRMAVEDLGWGDRAVGMSLWGDLELARPGVDRLRWQMGVTNNALSGAPHGFDVHARLTYDPTVWLSFGANGVVKSVQDPLADEAACRSTWERGDDCRRSVFAAGGDVAFDMEGLYASVEVDLAQDWRNADGSPWMLGALGYASYELGITERTRLQPVVFAEYVDSNLNYDQSEAIRAGANFNILWTKYLRIMPQVEFIEPLKPVTSFNRFVSGYSCALWIAVQL